MLEKDGRKVYEISDSGLKVGKVIFKKEVYEAEDIYYPNINDSPSIVYDVSSGNMHLFPKNLKDAMTIGVCIKEKLENLIQNPEWENLSKHLELKDYKIKKRGFGRVPSFDSLKEYPNLKHMYAFLSVEIKGASFELLPFCFEIDEDKVNCEFGAYQFCRGINKVKAYQLYPKKGSTGVVINNIEVCKNFNPTLNFESDDREVINKFVEYITEQL